MLRKNDERELNFYHWQEIEIELTTSSEEEENANDIMRCGFPDCPNYLEKKREYGDCSIKSAVKRYFESGGLYADLHKALSKGDWSLLNLYKLPF